MKNWRTEIKLHERSENHMLVSDFFLLVLRHSPREGLAIDKIAQRLPLIDIVEATEEGAEFDFSPNHLVTLFDLYNAHSWPVVSAAVVKIRDELRAEKDAPVKKPTALKKEAK